MQYDFRFLTDVDATASHDDTHCWYPVRDVLKAEDTVDLADFLVDRQLGNQRGPLKFLARLHKVVHTEPVIAYYEEDDRDLDKVLDIFIRYEQRRHDAKLFGHAHEHGHGTVEEPRRPRRDPRHSGRNQSDRGRLRLLPRLPAQGRLMLADVGSVRFRITNFNSDNMKLLEARWDRITRAVRTAVELVARFGISQSSLTAHNAVLPIAHYLYRRDTPAGFLSHAVYRQDRDAIRIWLIRSLLKRGIWGSGLDSLLTALRSVIDTHGGDAFPAANLEAAMRVRGKSLTFEEEEFEDLVESKDRTFTLLSLLYPFVDLQNNKFHIDHVFPKSRFSSRRLRLAGVAEDDIPGLQDRADRLPTCNCSSAKRTRAKATRSRNNGWSQPLVLRRPWSTPSVTTLATFPST